MSYQVIARKWRPRTFENLVGQNHITQTLMNALRAGRLPHALLFTGPRGTGKTSSARILAKSLRCPSAKDFVPCNTCTVCEEIGQGNHVDVIEIDGASNNGVDAIRELRESVIFMPAQGTHKIYIIDEVHMLSNSAFNALLKTLEEPPSHVVFILATTEVHKIPATILSRCQRYDFRRIATKQIVERLKYISQSENLSATEESLWLIAKQGDGSMRDAQSLLDQVINFCDGELTSDKIVSILGLTNRALLLKSFELIAMREKDKVFQLLQDLHESGFDPQLISQELLELTRHLLLLKLAPERASSLLDLPDSEQALLLGLANGVQEEEIHLIFDMLLKGAQDLARAQDPRLVLEMLLFRLSSAPSPLDLRKILNSVSTQAPTPNSVQKPTPIPSPRHQASNSGFLKETSKRFRESQSLSEIPSGLEKMKAAIEVKDKWMHFVDAVRNEDALFAAKLENLLFVRTEGEKILLSVPERLEFLKDQMRSPDIRKKLQSFIASHWGPLYSFDVVGADQKTLKGESAQHMSQRQKKREEEDVQAKVAENPAVQSAQKIFNAKIKSVE